MGMYEQIARNKRRTFVMLAAFVLLIAAVAVALGIIFKAGVAIVPIAIVIAIAMAWTSYFASDRIALAASRAKPADGPEYARYHNLVEGLFTAVGAIALMADLGLRFMWFGGREGRRDNNDGGIGVILAILSLALLILAPFIAQLMQFAMSRRRELLADASGVQLTRYPPGLISALKKLQDDQSVVHYATRATAQMWIESPLERVRQAERAEARGDATGPKKGTWLNR